MKNIIGRLGIDLIFSIDEKDFEDLLDGTGFKPRESYDDEVSTTLRRMRAREKRVSEQGIAALSSGGMTIEVYETPEKLIAFLKHISEKDKGESGPSKKMLDGILALKYYLTDFILEGSMIDASKRHHLTKQIAGLEKVLGFSPIDATLDLFHPDEDYKKWFHLTVGPESNRGHMTSVRLVLSRMTIEEMIKELEKVPRIIKEIQSLLGP